MEVNHAIKLQSPKLGGPSTGQARRRSTKLLELPENEPGMGFDPRDPYSAAMDNIPLKDLFPNVKVRKRAHERKVETLDTPSPRSMETQDSVRNKLRESLAAALRSVADFDHNPEREWKPDCQTDDGHSYVDEQSKQRLGQVKVEGLTGEVEGVDSEYSMSGGSLDPDQGGGINRSGLTEQRSNFLTNRTMYLAQTEEEPYYKRMKLEAEVNEEDDVNQLNVSKRFEEVAEDIEAELFRHFGGVNRKYKEKARSLLFNLKDRSNPELRTRVLSGEISPQNLCIMNAEQLASKELSEWRIAKAEEFAHMVVLMDTDTEQRRLVKKTHKGEFEVQVEKDDVLTEVVTGGVRQIFTMGTKQETFENGANVPEGSGFVDNEMHKRLVQAGTQGLEFSPIRDPISMSSMSPVDDHVYDASYEWDVDKEDIESLVEPCFQEDVDKDDRVPAIMSLDEYFVSNKDLQLGVPIKAEDVEPDSLSYHTGMDTSPLATPKGKGLQKPVGSPNLKSLESADIKSGSSFQKEKDKHKSQEKLWEGSFQLSGSQISSVLAFYKSGDEVELQSWPKVVEIKGRVRLDALDKFLQDLHLSRTRSIMIIACCVDQDNISSVNAMEEVANQYDKGERVGYAEPAPGFEVYLFPGGGSSLKLLVEHGYLSLSQITAEEEGILLGCVVCRRSLIQTHSTHKTSSHYFTAHRHALSGRLDSPTRPSDQWTGHTAALAKTSSVRLPIPSSHVPLQSGLEDKNAKVSFTNAQSNGSVPNAKNKDTLTAANKSMPSSLQHFSQNPLLSQSSQSPQVPECQDLPAWSQKNVSKEDDNSDDIPPGFGPKAMAMVKPFIEHSTVHDNDDLPEFDFTAESNLQVLTNSTLKPSEVPREIVSPVPQTLGPSFPQVAIFPQMPQIPLEPAGFSLQPIRPGPFEQFNPTGHPSYLPPRPILSQGHGPQVNASQQLPQLFQQTHFHTMRPQPPPLPPPIQPLNTLPPRPHQLRDASFLASPPPQMRPLLPRPPGDPLRPEHFPSVLQEQRARGDFSRVISHPSGSQSQNTMTSMDLRHRNTNQASNLWNDDDDMPEWCPPPVIQQEIQHVPPHHIPARPIVEAQRPGLIKEAPLHHMSAPQAVLHHMPVRPIVDPRHPGMVLRTVFPQSMGQGWPGMPPHMVPEMRKGPMHPEARGILQAPVRPPAPALQYSGPLGRGILPAIRFDQLSGIRGMKVDIRPGESRELKRHN